MHWTDRTRSPARWFFIPMVNRPAGGFKSNPSTRGTPFVSLNGWVEAESSARGIPPDRVAFQEAGAWDAIAEIVGAAALIHALGKVHWTASPLPCPELITPTGAAIVGYLCPQGAVNGDSPQVRALFGSGTGFAARGRSSDNSRMRVHRLMTYTVSAVAERFGRQIGP
jgi:hypothetical protein